MKYDQLMVCIVLLSKMYCSDVQANPIQGLVDPNCFVVKGDCPNENVTFWLYTNATRDTPVQLDPLNLRAEHFAVRRPLKILLHGYTGHRDFAPSATIRPALLAHEDVYVISPDYGPLVRYPCYFAAVDNLPLASKCLAQLVNNLVAQKLVRNEDIHIIGFSLGAQVAGQTANYVQQKLRRITGLDPAKPMFITVGDERKLDKDDATFVDVIHTDVLGRGMLHTMGHVDFYPNFGPEQPGCQQTQDTGSCNHDRAPRYYAESINRTNEFWSYSCASWFRYVLGLCAGNTNDALMGYYVNKSLTGSFFLKTSHESPFALGPLHNIVSSAEQHKLMVYYNVTDLNDEDFEPQLRRVFVNDTTAIVEIVDNSDTALPPAVVHLN